MTVCDCVRKLRFWLPFGQTPSPYPNSRQYTPLSKNSFKVYSTLVVLETIRKQPVVLIILVHEVFMSGGPAGSPPLYVYEYLDCTICALRACLGTHRGQKRAPELLELELTDGC